MTFYDGAESFQLVFKSENGRGIGDTANDFDAYSLLGKEYIIVAVNLSSQIEIIERKTLMPAMNLKPCEGRSFKRLRRLRHRSFRGDHHGDGRDGTNTEGPAR